MSAMEARMAGQLEISTPSDTEILFRRSFSAPRQLVWDAHTKPELVKRWLTGPPGWSMPVCEIDLKVGGRFRYVWRNENGSDMGMGGEFREISEPQRIVHSELFDQDWTGGEAIVTMLLDETDGRTNMQMTVAYSSLAARDGALQTGMADGMEFGYANLDALLAEQV